MQRATERLVRLARRGARSVVGNGLARTWLAEQRVRKERLRHAIATVLPAAIRARPFNITVAVNAGCNLRCEGCHYGNGAFMPGEQLPLAVMETMLDDAAAAGVETVRLYGGEPLLHPDLPRVVEHAFARGLDPYITTNGILLDRRIDDLRAAGLEFVSIGFYGIGSDYDGYVGRAGAFERLERSIATVRDRHGDDVKIRLNWLLMRPSCDIETVRAVAAFARGHGTPFKVDLIHYSLPYFSEGADARLQFRDEDRPRIDAVVDELLSLHREHPGLIEQTEAGLRSIPDWLLLGPDMRVPCDKYRMLWIGADGTVQLCYVTFPLGNLHDRRLGDMLFTSEHRKAATGCFGLDCPNCHCGYDDRVNKHGPSLRRYS